MFESMEYNIFKKMREARKNMDYERELKDLKALYEEAASTQKTIMDDILPSMVFYIRGFLEAYDALTKTLIKLNDLKYKIGEDDE